jgi:hypothetical protein
VTVREAMSQRGWPNLPPEGGLWHTFDVYDPDEGEWLSTKWEHYATFEAAEQGARETVAFYAGQPGMKRLKEYRVRPVWPPAPVGALSVAPGEAGRLSLASGDGRLSLVPDARAGSSGEGSPVGKT